MEQTVEEWYNYFRALFPKLTTSSIDEFSARYKGSEEERQDILEAYEKFKGDVEAIMETVILLEEGEELRLFAILDNAIEQKEIKRYKKYTQFKDTFDEKKRSNKRSVKDINLEATEDSFSSLRDSILAKKSQKDPFESILNKYGGKSANGKSKEKLRQQYEAVPEEAFQSRKALRKSK